MAIFFNSCLLDVGACLCIIVGLIYYYLTSTFTFWEKRGVAYIKPEILFGNVKDIVKFKTSQFEKFLEFYLYFKRSGHKYGGIFQLRAPVLLVCSAEIAKDFLVKNFPYFHDRPIVQDENFDPFSAHLLALEGQKWKFVRSKLNPAFSTSKIKGMYIIMRKVAEEYMKILDKAAERGDMLEMRKSLSKYTMEIISKIAFGLDINALHEDSKFMEVGKRLFEPTKQERLMQILVNSFPWLYKTFKLRLFPKNITDFFTDVVRNNMEHRRKNNIEINDFFHFLMKIKEEKGTKLQDMEEMKGVKDYNMTVNENAIEFTEGVIAAQAFVFFLAGYETTSSAMSTCFLELAFRPELQDKIFDEVEGVIKKHGDLTYESLQDLVNLEEVIEEILRIHPPVGLIMRKCTQPYKIPNTETIIPKDCAVFVPIYSFHYDPEYFPDPEEFRPERFSPENRKKIEPYAYMPFGHGPRVCIGARLAMTQMKMSLASIIRKFKILKCEKTKPFRINPQSFFLLSRDGIWVRFSKR